MMLILFKDATIATTLMTRLKILAALFSSLHVQSEEKIQQPLLVIVQNTMPLYTIIGKKYSIISEVIEVTCELLVSINSFINNLFCRDCVICSNIL